MVARDRITVRETVGIKKNCKVNFFSKYFVRTKEEIYLSFKNSEKIADTSFKKGEGSI